MTVSSVRFRGTPPVVVRLAGRALDELLVPRDTDTKEADNKKSQAEHTKKVTIIGIVVGCIAAALILLALFLYFQRRRGERQARRRRLAAGFATAQEELAYQQAREEAEGDAELPWLRANRSRSVAAFPSASDSGFVGNGGDHPGTGTGPRAPTIRSDWESGRQAWNEEGRPPPDYRSAALGRPAPGPI